VDVIRQIIDFISKKKYMNESLKSIGLLSIRNIAILIFSMVRAKVLAVYLGPTGLGIVSQAINLHNFFWSTSAGGVNRGSTILFANYLAEKDFTRINSLLLTSLLFLTITGVLVNILISA
jgi:O-antigen/teichoic acid export membrane protein